MSSEFSQSKVAIVSRGENLNWFDTMLGSSIIHWECFVKISIGQIRIPLSEQGQCSGPARYHTSRSHR